jgi:pimeloyl-ACP methyl ester carboxylesterase
MSDFGLPETRYALSGDVNIAYQVMGDGPIDIILVPGIASHVEFLHEFAGYTAFLRRLSSFARIVTFDKRGQGLSDRIAGAASLEQRIDDVGAVMDAVGSKQAVLLGFSEGSPMSALFAATYPERVSKLILFGGYAVANLPEEMRNA